jgi:hypothetical protein
MQLMAGRFHKPVAERRGMGQVIHIKMIINYQIFEIFLRNAIPQSGYRGGN